MSDTAQIERTEITTADVYEGTREQLIEAGLVRADQFPPPGRYRISYVAGKVVRGNCRKDETYLSVFQYLDGSCFVHVGVPREVSQQRKATAKAEQKALRAKWIAAKEREEREKDAADARHACAELANTPKSESAYRRIVVQAFRHWAGFGINQMAGIPKHGYSLEADSLVAIQASFDAVVDQIMRATVCFDGPAHLVIVGALQARIAKGEPAVTLKVAQLVKANPAILAGDAA